jgi:hypothetical protein
MKKMRPLVLIWLFAAAGLSGQSAAVASPKAGDVWPAGSQRTILWSHSGQAAVRLLLLAPSGAKAGIIKSKLALADGTCPWTVAKLENGQTVPPAKGYKIVLKIVGTNVNLASAGPFEIAAAQAPPAGVPPVAIVPIHPGPVNPSIPPGQILSLLQVLTIHSPKGGDVWKPMADYAITWEAIKNKYPASAYDFNLKLVAADNSSFSPLLLKQNHWATAKQTANSNIYTFNFKFLGSMNIPSGKYKVTVQSVKVPDFKAKSGVFTVQNNISGDTGFIGEDEPDLKIEEVYYDVSKKSMWIRIQNQGFSSYAGPLTINYKFKIAGITYAAPGCPSGEMSGETKFPNITLNKFQSNAYLICKWPCFDKRPADFFPITGPVDFDIFIWVKGDTIASKTGVICKCKGPDIIVDDPFQIQGKYDPDYLSGFQQVSLDPRDFNWISENTFEAKVAVKVRNWGCQGLQFKIMLHMDGNYLNGKKEAILGTVTLQSGQETTFVSGPVKFSIPKDGQYYKMLLVAHQSELTGEGYPDAYKNNFILTHVRLKEKSNTVRGVVDW